MPNLNIEQGQKSHSAMDLHGKWWCPEYPESKVSGTFKFDDESGGVLTLDGGLKFSEEREFDSTIFGDVQGLHLTLDRCFRVNVETGFRSVGGNYTKEIWTCTTVLRNAHLELGAEEKFTAFEFSTRVLPAWVRLGRPKVNLGDPSRIETTIEIPPQIEIDLEDGAKMLWRWGYTTQTKANREGLEIRITPSINVTTGEKTLNEIHNEYITPLLYFFTFASGLADDLSSLHLFRTSTDLEGTLAVEVFQSRPPKRWGKEDRIYPERVLINFKEVQANLGTILNSWFKIFLQSRFALNNYFSTYFTFYMFSDEKFLRTLSSLEAWHISYHGTAVADNFPEIERIRELVLKDLSVEDSQLMADKFSRMKWPSLRERLDKLILLAIPRLKTYLESQEDFTKRCSNTRNGIIHHYTPENAYTGTDFYWADLALKALFINLVLAELGFSESQADTALLRSYEGLSLRLNAVN